MLYFKEVTTGDDKRWELLPSKCCARANLEIALFALEGQRY